VRSQERRPSRSRLPRRRTDRIEDGAAWLLTTAGLLLLLFGAVTGLGVHGALVERGRAAEHEVVRVDAVLLADSPVDDGAPGSTTPRTARYVDAAGQAHEVVLPGVGRAPAGSSVLIWVDRAGRLAAAPPTGADAVVIGIVACVGTIGVGCAVLVGLWLGVRRWLLARNTAAWAREWAVVEPEWSGRDR
jgi:hypothetical protein